LRPAFPGIEPSALSESHPHFLFAPMASTFAPHRLLVGEKCLAFLSSSPLPSFFTLWMVVFCSPPSTPSFFLPLFPFCLSLLVPFDRNTSTMSTLFPFPLSGRATDLSEELSSNHSFCGIPFFFSNQSPPMLCLVDLRSPVPLSTWNGEPLHGFSRSCTAVPSSPSNFMHRHLPCCSSNTSFEMVLAPRFPFF